VPVFNQNSILVPQKLFKTTLSQGIPKPKISNENPKLVNQKMTYVLFFIESRFTIWWRILMEDGISLLVDKKIGFFG
jgi:hypothetical protein